jgi:hypothetical protein
MHDLNHFAAIPGEVVAMPIVQCQKCQTRLRAPDAAAGKAVRCPQCQSAVPIAAAAGTPVVTAPEPELENVPAARRTEEDAKVPFSLAADDEPEDRVDLPFPKRSKPKKKKKSKKEPGGFRFPAIAIEDNVKHLLLGVLAFIAMAVVGYYLFRTPPPDEIPESQWVAVEVPNRFRAKLPGNASVKSEPAPGGGTLVMHTVQPDKDSVYAVGYSEGVLPRHRRDLPAEQLLNDACDGMVANTARMGSEEADRFTLDNAPFPAKQIILKIPQARGRMIARVYIAHGRVFVVMAGGRGFHEDQANVTRLFESFGILDPGPPEPEPKPGPKAGPEPKPEPKTPPGLIEVVDNGDKYRDIVGLAYATESPDLLMATELDRLTWYNPDAKKPQKYAGLRPTALSQPWAS